MSAQTLSLSSEDVIRAWENPDYRHSLPAEIRSMLPDHPSGNVLESFLLTLTLNEKGKQSIPNCSASWCSVNFCSQRVC